MAILYAPAPGALSAGFRLPYSQPLRSGRISGPFIYDTLGPETDGTCPKSHSTDKDLGMRLICLCPVSTCPSGYSMLPQAFLTSGH